MVMSKKGRAYLIKNDDRRCRCYGPILLLLYLVDHNVVIPGGVDDESFRVRTPGYVRRVVEIDVHSQRLVFFLAQVSDIPQDD